MEGLHRAQGRLFLSFEVRVDTLAEHFKEVIKTGKAVTHLLNSSDSADHSIKDEILIGPNREETEISQAARLMQT